MSFKSINCIIDPLYKVASKTWQIICCHGNLLLSVFDINLYPIIDVWPSSGPILGQLDKNWACTGPDIYVGCVDKPYTNMWKYKIPIFPGLKGTCLQLKCGLFEVQLVQTACNNVYLKVSVRQFSVPNLLFAPETISAWAYFISEHIWNRSQIT